MVQSESLHGTPQGGKVRFLLHHSIPEGMRFYTRGDTKMTKEMQIRRLLEHVWDYAQSESRHFEQMKEYYILKGNDSDSAFEESQKRLFNLSAENVQKENEAINDFLWRIIAIMDGCQLEGIKIDGHRGKWYAIDGRMIKGTLYLLLEHETYGDEAASLIVTAKTHKVILDDVWNGWEDYEEAFCD